MAELKGRVPCVFQVWDEASQKDVTRQPPVNCAHQCGKCGWNPAVAARRKRKIREPKVTRYYHTLLPSPTDQWGLPPWKADWERTFYG